MINVTHIISLDLPELQLYRSMKGKPFPFADKYFVAEGEKLVQRLLKSNLTIESILLAPKWFDKYHAMIESRSEEKIDVYIADENLIAAITGITMHQCIMAVAHVPPPIDVKSYTDNLPSPHLIVALDGIVDAENMGGIVRNCAAFSVDLLIIDKTCCSPFLRRAARVSMGGIFSVPIAQVDDLTSALQQLDNTTIVAAHVDKANTNLVEYQLPQNVCFVFGSEANGISQRVLDVCQERVWIPMAKGFNSLNVVNASAVFLYEVKKRNSFSVLR